MWLSGWYNCIHDYYWIAFRALTLFIDIIIDLLQYASSMERMIWLTHFWHLIDGWVIGLTHFWWLMTAQRLTMLLMYPRCHVYGWTVTICCADAFWHGWPLLLFLILFVWPLFYIHYLVVTCHTFHCIILDFISFQYICHTFYWFVILGPTPLFFIMWLFFMP